MTCTSPSFRSASTRRLLLAGVSVLTLLALVQPAQAGQALDALRGGGGGSNAAAAAQAAATANAAAAQIAGQQSRRNVTRALDALKGAQAAQAAARAAAAGVTNLIDPTKPIRDGLGETGLNPGGGAVISVDGASVDLSGADGGKWQGVDSIKQQLAGTKTTVTVEQGKQQALLTWKEFNVGRDTTLSFDQQGNASWVAVNRVEAGIAPSQILGNLKADGQVYVINQNGIVFGGASQVNVHALVASTADIVNTATIYSAQSGSNYLPSFEAPEGGYDTATNSYAGLVRIEAGAEIATKTPTSATAGGGFVMLLGQTVENRGTISTPKGQALLAAGDDFILRKGYGTDSNSYSTTRGNEVATGSWDSSTSTWTPGGGTVTNQGIVFAQQGDITLAGRRIVQDGILLATTSVNTRGTIHLLNSASDTSGSIAFADGSLTQILPELESDETALDSKRDGLISDSVTQNNARIIANFGQFDNLSKIGDRQDQGRIEIVTGGLVDFQSGSLTMAQGGQIAVSAGRRVFTADGAALDVSGTSTTLAMAANQIEVNIQGNELRDSPLNRESDALKNEDVWIDIRDLVLVPAGTGGYETDRYYTKGGLLEVSGHLANTKHGIGEWAAVGGTITLSAPEVVAQKGSVFNLSGGSLAYEGGTVRVTNVIGADGKVYTLSDAPANMEFVAMGDEVVVNHARWGVIETYRRPFGIGRETIYTDPGYTVGRDAGRLILSNSTLTSVFEGTVVAEVFNGVRQTEARPSGVDDGYKHTQYTVAKAGSLLLGNYTVADSSGIYGNAAIDVKIGDIAGITAGMTATDALPGERGGTARFDAALLNEAGLGGLSIVSSEKIDVASDVALSDGGEIELIAPTIDIKADITVRGGDVVLTNVAGNIPLSPAAGRPAITVEDGVTIDTRGLWTNLLTDPDADPSRTAYVDGGNVTIRSTGDVVFKAGASIDASSGGAILASGEAEGGRGGDITLSASYDAGIDGLGAARDNHGNLTFDGKVVSNGVLGGGALTLETGGEIVIGGIGYGHGDTLVAGTAAPYDMVLTESLTVSAGEVLPFPAVGQTSYAKAGQTIDGGMFKIRDDKGGYLKTHAEWIAPGRLEYSYNADGSDYVRVEAGDPVPANVYLVYTRATEFMGQEIYLDPNVFPNGIFLGFGTFITTKFAAGDLAEASTTYAAGTFVPKGTILGQNISVQALKSSSLDAGLFDSGFSSYTINGAGGLTVAEGTDIAATMPVYRFTKASLAAATGTDPSAALELWTPPLYLENAVTAELTQRAGADITLMAASITGRVTIAPDASVTVDPGRSITLSSGGSIEVQGRLTAHGGSISLLESFADKRTEANGETAVSEYGGQGRTHWVGENAVLDVSGIAHTATDAQGRRYGIVRDGGSIKFGRAARSAEDYDTIGLASAADAFIVIEKGARLDASGISAILDIQAGTGLGGESRAIAVASDGGSITLKSYNGILVEGTLEARAGGTGAAGGTLHVMLETPNYAANPDGFRLSVPDAWLVGRVLTVGQSSVPGALPAGADPLTADLTPGHGGIAADAIMAGGFDTLFLGARDAILFDGDVSLSAGRSITLRTGAFHDTAAAGAVSIAAPYVSLDGNGALAISTSTRMPTALPASITGLAGGRFSAEAGLIDIRGTQANNFTDIGLVSRGDLRFLASPVPDNYTQSSPITLFSAPNGNLELIARQVYPATGVAATVMVGSILDGSLYKPVSPGATLTIGSVDGVTPDLPYSAFGSLKLIAPVVEQGGVVRAPLGSLTLGVSPSYDYDAAIPDTSVTLLPGSITSVSGKGLTMPFGGTADGTSYVLDGVTAVTANLLTGEFQIGASTYVQGITLDGVDVRVESGAVVDMSGGGDLLGAAFVSGRGGSVDVLTTPLVNANPASSYSKAGNQVYAIVPGVDIAPVTGGYYSAWNGATPMVGQQIIIPGGVPGLAAGTYTLLPANYALLPGAFRVELGATGTAAARISGVHNLGGGVYVTAGYQGVAGTSIRDALPTQTIITPAAMVRVLSHYNDTSYSDFQLAQAELFDTVRTLLPRDGKFLAINLGQTIESSSQRDALTFNGAADFAADSAYKNAYGGGLILTTTDRGGDLNTLQITGDDSVTQRSGTVTTVKASAISAMGAASVYLGGRPTLSSTSSASIFIRNTAGSGGAQNVTLEGGAVLRGAQLFLFGETITLEDGATIDTLGQGIRAPDSRTGYAFTNYAPSQYTRSSLLAVSNGHVVLDATNAAYSGDIRIGDGVRLLTDGTLGLLTQNGATFDGTPVIAARELGLALSSINIGSAEALAAATLPPGMKLDQGFIDRLVSGGIESLALSAAESINFYGDATLDFTVAGEGVGQLVLSAPAIYGAGAADDTARIKVDTLVWNGTLLDKGKSSTGAQIWESGVPGAIVPGGAGTGSGAFVIDARTIVLGYADDGNPETTTTLDRLMLGFSAVDFRASEAIVARDKGTLSVFQSADPDYDGETYDAVSYAGTGGKLNFTTPLLTGDPGAILKVRAGGDVVVAAPEGVGPSTAKPSALGVDISLTSGGGLTLDTAVFLPTGRLSLTAAGDLVLGERAQIDLSGQAVAFYDATKYTWGGDLALESTNGNITQLDGSVIDISATGNDAGSLTLTATGASAGQVTLSRLAGALKATGGDGFNGGSFDIRAQKIGVDKATLSEDFAALNTRLSADGFTESRSFVLKRGDLVIGDELKAHEIIVSVDGGSLRIDGTVDASGARVGSIILAARDDLVVNGTLDARGTTVDRDSNGAAIAANNTAKIDLTSRNGTLRLVDGAVFDLSTPDGVSYGELTLNAPRTAETSGDVAIDASGPITVRGVKNITLNAFWSYDLPDDGVIDQALLDGYDTASAAFMDNAYSAGVLNAGLQSRLAGILGNPAYASALHLRPGVEITSIGDLSVEGGLDLSGYRYGPNANRDTGSATYGAGEAMALVIRAAGDVDVSGSISDGYMPETIVIIPEKPEYIDGAIDSGSISTSPLYEVGEAGYDAVTFDPVSGYVNFTQDLYVVGDWTVPTEESGFFLMYFDGSNYYYPGDKILDGTLLQAADFGINFPFGVTPPRLAVTYTKAEPAKQTGDFAWTMPKLASGSPSSSISIVAGADLSAADTRTLQAFSRQTYSAGGEVLEGRTDIVNDPNFFLSENLDWGWGTLTDAYMAGEIVYVVGKDWTVPDNTFYQFMSDWMYNVDIDGNTYAPGSVVPKGTKIQYWTFDAAESLPQLAEAIVTRSRGYSGSLTLHNPELRDAAEMPMANVLRTGAGALDLRAAGNLSQASLYNISTNGREGAPADLSVAVQGDLTGYIYYNSSGFRVSSFVTNWLDGNQGSDDFDDGFTGLGALGGGRVDIRVGGDAGELLPPVHTRVTSSINIMESTGLVVAATSGDVTLDIGGRLNPYSGLMPNNEVFNIDMHGVFTALRGDLTLKAGAIGSIPIQYGFNQVNDPRGLNHASAAIAGANNTSVSYSLYGAVTAVVGDGATSLLTRGDLVLGQVGAEASKAYWTPQTSLSLFSAGGNVTPITTFTYETSGVIPGYRSYNGYATRDRGGNIAGSMLPPAFSAVAASGSLYNRAALRRSSMQPSELSYTLMASPYGNLELLAMESIYGASTSMAPGFNAGYQSPRWVMLSDDSLTLHDGDANPIRVYAVKGDIVNVTLGNSYDYIQNGMTYTAYDTAKAARILAGGDIVNFGGTGNYYRNSLGFPNDTPLRIVSSLILNTGETDVSVIRAGRNIYYANVDIAGPGTLEMTAGGAIYQGNRGSVTSVGTKATGDTRDGASIFIAAGLGSGGPDYAALYQYLDPANLLPTGSILEGSGKVAKTYEDELAAWLKERFGYKASSAADALAYLRALPMEQQRIFLGQVYFAELKAGGREYNDPDSRRYGSYLRGRQMVAALFPDDRTYAGDLVMFGNSGIRTLYGGDITILTPGGRQVIGVEGLVPGAGAGLITQGAGDISLYSKGSILLGLSRIMTTFGGNILAWSAEGDINAGRGAKTTIVYTPPRRVYSAYGDVTLSPVVPSAGAGIATLDPIPEVPPGDIDLIAPLGTIDAGEAGIRVSGDINIVAMHLVNAANIQVQGKSMGIPVVAAPNIGALTAASNTAGSAAGAAEAAARASRQTGPRTDMPSIITVEVIGYGGGEGAGRPPNDRQVGRWQRGYNPDSAVQFEDGGGQ